MKNHLSVVNKKVTKIVCIAFSLIYIVIMTGCSHTAPSKYYVLTPIKDTATPTEFDAGKIHIIGVGPVKFPKYLNRSQLIRFSGENEVVLEEFNRWAEPIEQNFTRVLRTNLTRLLESSYAIDYPWKRSLNVRYQIMLDIHQFETDPDGSVTLKAHWAIFSLSKNKKMEVVRKFKYSKKLDEIDFSKIVAQQSKALEMLSQDIAKEMQKLVEQ
jgi:uncharacterized lipoprotein YmbA